MNPVQDTLPPSFPGRADSYNHRDCAVGERSDAEGIQTARSQAETQRR